MIVDMDWRRALDRPLFTCVLICHRARSWYCRSPIPLSLANVARRCFRVSVFIFGFGSSAGLAHRVSVR